MLLLGIDLGTSSIKVPVVDGANQKSVASAQFPETEEEIISLHQGWAEQSPDTWWNNVKEAIKKVHKKGNYDPKDIGAIGIAYQMHGLVLIDKAGKSLRNSIIWCDSRAVPYGDEAFEKIGEEKCLHHLLNSPGNFTASKLAWVKENEPDIFARIHKVMLPGDFIAMKLTGNITTTPSALSEGIFWDFKKNDISRDVMTYFGFDKEIIPDVQDVFSEHGKLSEQLASELSLRGGIPVTYKSGDQPNNALSLNVLQPGEVAATAGTSGVIYGISDKLTYDPQSRVNSFAHVNHHTTATRVGVLLCINGTGILNKWIRTITGSVHSYQQMDAMAATLPPGSDGLIILPFGNGAERMLGNMIIGSHIHGIDFNKHTSTHFYRAAQEGIAFAFRYGLDIMRQNQMTPQLIRAGRANMFLSPVFTEAFVNATGVPIQLIEGDGSVGAAIGAGIGKGFFSSASDAFDRSLFETIVEPSQTSTYNDLYHEWKNNLQKHMTVPSEALAV